jgi:hypothetical protein
VVVATVTGAAPTRVTTYDVAPAEAVHDRTTCVLPAVATRPVGVKGIVTGATGVADTAVEAADVPAVFAAATVNEYSVLFVRPVAV